MTPVHPAASVNLNHETGMLEPEVGSETTFGMNPILALVRDMEGSKLQSEFVFWAHAGMPL